MPRALTAEWVRVEPGDRESFTQRSRERREHFTAEGCQYWIFESAVDAGIFLEFVEARDAEVLARARADLIPVAAIFTELDLS